MIATHTTHAEAERAPTRHSARPFLLPSRSLVSTLRSLSEFCYRRSVLSSSGFYVTGMAQGVLFCVWLLSLHVLSVSFLQATACVNSPLSFFIISFPLCGCRGSFVGSSPCTEFLFSLDSNVSVFCLIVCPFLCLVKETSPP